MKQKILFFSALLLLFSNIAIAQSPVLPPGVVFPDNIIDADCVGTPPSVTWTFKQLATSPSAYPIDNSHIPLVGDIDNDGKIEIITMGRTNQTQHTRILYIFEVDPVSSVISLQQQINIPYINRVNNPYAIASVDGNGYASLFLCTSYHHNTASDRLQLIKYVYSPITGQYEQSWRTTYSTRNDREMGQPMLVDFNGDGVAEVVVLDKVFNAQTGALLVDGGHLADNNNGFGFGGHVMTISRWGTGTTTWSSIMAIGDIDNDGVPEVIGGKTVYKVTINNPVLQDGTNKFEILRHVNTTGHAEAVDGPTAIADMTGDGLLDVVVTGNRKNGTASLYVWDPRTGDVLHTSVISNIPTTANEHSASVPMIGDIDGDGQLEIVVTGKERTRAYEFDAAARTLTQKWNITTNDSSVATGMVMFDFDQDGTQEIVYRDMTHLRILNGHNGSNKITPISCTSETANEYPLVVDINNDQAAEIIVTSTNTLRIFSSQNVSEKWAPARKVWNQYAYNAVNVNDDLTIPRRQMNPATRFAGNNGVLGDNDDVYPFNGYLVQQTILNTNGEPLWLLPEGKIVGTPTFVYDEPSKEMTITVNVTNAGDAAFQNPFYVTTYKNSIGNAQKFTYKYENTIAVGDTVSLTFKLANYNTLWAPNSGIVININDNGNGNTDQRVCGTANTQYLYYGLLPTQQNACIGLIKDLICNFSISTNDTYQWQSSPNGSTTWTDIPDETAAVYAPAKRRGTIYYRVVVTNDTAAEIINSESVSVRVRSCKLPVNHNISVMGYYD